MKLEKNKRTIFFILWLAATVFIFTNSMQVAEVSNESSGRVVLLLQKLGSLFGIQDVQNLTFYVRKGAHMFEFFLQSLMLASFFALGETAYRKRVVYVLFAGLFSACIDEFIQLFVEGRSGMIQDVFIDFAGVLIGALAGFLIWKVRTHKQHKKKCGEGGVIH